MGSPSEKVNELYSPIQISSVVSHHKRKRENSYPHGSNASTSTRNGELYNTVSLNQVNESRDPLRHSQRKTTDEEKEEVNCDKYFCLSLLETLKRIDPRQKSIVKIEIMKLLNDAAWPSNGEVYGHTQDNPKALDSKTNL